MAESDTVGAYGFIADIARQVREAIRPHLYRTHARAAADRAFSGDTTFRVDVVAEETLAGAIQNHDRRLAYFSEDKGLVEIHPDPEWLLVVDPIDGTRPLMCGFAMGVVSIALCPFSTTATFADILAGAVLEIHSGDLYYAEREGGVRVHSEIGRNVRPSVTTDLERMFWSYDTVGRPSRWVHHYLGDLIDVSGMQAAVFVINNAAQCLTKIVNGDLDAYVEVGGRILEEHPESASEFMNIGNGRMMGTFPYDIAAGYAILREAGCVITDAFGRSLESVPLTGHGREAILSIVAASNGGLHSKLLAALQSAEERNTSLTES